MNIGLGFSSGVLNCSVKIELGVYPYVFGPG